MKDGLKELFFRGSYQELLTRALNQEIELNGETLPWVVGSLSFVGRIAEARQLYLANLNSASRQDLIISRFFLGTALARTLQRDEARRLFALNRREGQSDQGRFFALHGLAMHRYYSGQFGSAQILAEASLRISFSQNFPYGRLLASDLLGHLEAVTGSARRGTALIQSASQLAASLGNTSHGRAARISALLYEAQFGLREDALNCLSREIESTPPEDFYSLSNLHLEIARQLTLRGDWTKALQNLECAARKIYQHGNPRQEIALNLRWSELQYRQGKTALALSHLRGALNLLEKSPDPVHQLAAEGMERKLRLSLGITEAPARISKLSTLRVHARICARTQGVTPPPPDDDHVGALIDLAKSDTSNDTLSAIHESGLWALFQEILGVKPGQAAIVLGALPDHLLAIGPEGIELSGCRKAKLPLSLLCALATGPHSKERLVKAVWGYEYHSLRHDPMVYSSIQALRKILGRYGHWIQATNNGYAFDESVEIRTSSRPSPRAEKRREVKREMVLTRRQAKIHEIVSKAGYVNVTDIMRSAKVSKATAVRALSEMTQMKLLKRLGRARATHYCLENSEKT